MGIVEWAVSPWGQHVPIHIAWFLIWVAAILALLFLMVHAVYVRYFARREEFTGTVSPTLAASLPPRVPRHSLVARLFHWIMAAAMFTLLLTAFLPKIGIQFDWVTYHWIAGTVLTVSIVFHVIHASFWLDFWAIWPDKEDLQDAGRRIQRFFGRPAPIPLGPAAIARRLGTPLLPVCVTRLPDDSYLAEATPLVTVEETDDPKADQIRATEQVLRRIETFIQAHPEQWHVPHRIWEGTT